MFIEKLIPWLATWEHRALIETVALMNACPAKNCTCGGVESVYIRLAFHGETEAFKFTSPAGNLGDITNEIVCRGLDATASKLCNRVSSLHAEVT